MTADLKARLLERRVSEADVDLELGTVHVRGLTRGEVFAANKVAGDDTERLERLIVARGLLDPAMTEAEVETWQRNSPAGEIEPVVQKIKLLSGLADDADKESYKSDGGGSVAGVRDVPRDEAVDDGGRAAGADE